MAKETDALLIRARAQADLGWTPERVAALTRLHTKGLSYSEIARQLGGLTRNAVNGKIDRLKLSSATAGAARHDQCHLNGRAARSVLIAPSSSASPPPFDFPTHPAPPTAKPWIMRRRGQCAFPVGEEGGAGQLSCCAPCEGTYCAEHARIAFQPFRPSQPKDGAQLERSLRRALG